MNRLRRWATELRAHSQGWRFAAQLPEREIAGEAEPGRLETYFDAHTEGPGIWKWRHYLRAYERHFEPFVGQNVDLIEIGIFSGGSLPMWREHFGPGCTVYGVDIDPACRAYAGPNVRVFIGDQADSDFWAEFVKEVPGADIVIDDGGHEAHQQIATFEALFPCLNPGGLYICEDIHGAHHQFHSYIDGFTRGLNTMQDDPLKQHVLGVHRYPYLVVIEKSSGARVDLAEASARRGTQWHPDSEP